MRGKFPMLKSCLVEFFLDGTRILCIYNLFIIIFICISWQPNSVTVISLKTKIDGYCGPGCSCRNCGNFEEAVEISSSRIESDSGESEFCDSYDTDDKHWNTCSIDGGQEQVSKECSLDVLEFSDRDEDMLEISNFSSLSFKLPVDFTVIMCLCIYAIVLLHVLYMCLCLIMQYLQSPCFHS